MIVEISSFSSLDISASKFVDFGHIRRSGNTRTRVYLLRLYIADTIYGGKTLDVANKFNVAFVLETRIKLRLMVLSADEVCTLINAVSFVE